MLPAVRAGHTPVEQGFHQVADVDVRQLVPLALEGEHGVRPEPHVAVDTRREVDAEERKTWIRHLQAERLRRVKRRSSAPPFDWLRNCCVNLESFLSY